MAISTSGSKKFSVNFVPFGMNNSAEIFVEFAAIMIAAGWTAVDFSDGTTVTTSGTPATFAQLTSNNAWQRMKAPTGTFEVEWQKDTTSWGWRAFFSIDGFEVAGAPTTLPSTAGTQFQIIGSGGGFDSSGWGWATTGAQIYRWHMCADSVPGQPDLYYFHMFGIRLGGTKHKRFTFSPLATGSFVIEDTAPWVATNEGTGATLISTSSWQGFYLHGDVGEAKAQGLLASNMQDFPSGNVASPENTSNLFARIFLRDTTAPGEQLKGAALDLFWTASPKAIVPEFSTLNLTTAWGSVAGGEPGAVFRYDELLIPWPDGVAPVI